MKTVCIAISKFAGNFPDGTEFDQPNKTGQINQDISPLRFRQNPQESGKISRNFLGNFGSGSHGFHALLALAGIGDFGWKPFYLKPVVSLFT